MMEERMKNIDESEPTSLVFHAKNAESVAATLSGKSSGWVGVPSSTDGSGAPVEGIWWEMRKDGITKTANLNLH
jgi:hypothetical protein